MDPTEKVLCGLLVERCAEAAGGPVLKGRPAGGGAARAVHVFATPDAPLDRERLEAFLEDLGRLARLDSPHLERIEGPFRDGDVHFYTTRWMELPSLEDLLRR